ncbi:MAG: undecaprenyl-phosphate glucose phosphotransferase [Deltaproteobacteria bacterium]|nr:undecaprenyl-phosphate glucose phosphotransferase [Deltaproteobacteria bacterium]
MLKKHWQFLSSVFAFADILIIAVSWTIAYHIRFSGLWWENIRVNPLSKQYLIILVPILILWPFIFKNMGLYKQRRISSIITEVFDVSKASTLAMIILVSTTYFIRKDEYSRLVFFYFWIISIILLSVERFILREFLRSFRQKGYNFRLVLIVGAGDLGVRVLKKVKSSPWSGLKVVGLIDDNITKGEVIEGHKVIGKTKNIRNIIKEYEVDQVFVALPVQAYKRLTYVVNSLSDETVTVRIVPDLYQTMTLNAGIEDFDGMPLINLTESPMYGWSVIVKRLSDILVASIALLLTSPLLLLISIIIKLTSSGPIVFKQKRYGLDGKEIKVYKFRTMSVSEDGEQVLQATKSDPRVTPFGAFLRKTSLDELPQFLNVLQGRMSVVGPRPHAVIHNEEYKKIVKSYMLRHKVKPGITGWAQVNGWRGETNTLEKIEKRVEHDLYYIENWSVWLDIKIMWLTIWKGFIHKHAY